MGGDKIVLWKTMKNKFVQNRAFAFMFLLYIALLIGDFVTTWSIRDILHLAESNIAYQATGSLLLPVLANLVVLWCFWHSYTSKRATPSSRFWTMAVMVVIIPLRIVAIKNAVTYMEMTPSVRLEAASAITSAQIQSVQTATAIAILAPIIYCLIVFFIWKVDHHVEKKVRGKNG